MPNNTLSIIRPNTLTGTSPSAIYSVSSAGYLNYVNFVNNSITSATALPARLLAGNSTSTTSEANLTIYSSSPSVYTSASTTATNGTWYIGCNGNTFISTLIDTSGRVLDTHSYTYIAEKPKKPDYKKIRFERNQARKALWKSIRLFENLFGINEIKLFLNGEAFEIEGRKFNYRISKRRDNLLDHTRNPSSHVIPYKLEVLSKQGLVLFSGCTVFKNTPIIDQITALILHIRDNEEHVLLNMNMSSMTSAFYQDADTIEYINTLKNCNFKPRLIGVT